MSIETPETTQIMNTDSGSIRIDSWASSPLVTA